MRRVQIDRSVEALQDLCGIDTESSRARKLVLEGKKACWVSFAVSERGIERALSWLASQRADKQERTKIDRTAIGERSVFRRTEVSASAAEEFLAERRNISNQIRGALESSSIAEVKVGVQ